MDIGYVEAIFIAVTALIALGSYVFIRDKNFNDRLADLNRWVHDEIIKLSNSCARRDDIKDMIAPIRHDMAELRHRQDDILKSLTKLKE